MVRKPFHAPGWTYEEKYDGYRILAYKEGDRVTLLSRNANDRTATYASVARAVAQIRARTVLLDGEVVAFDKERVSRFQLLQNGAAAAVYAVFDCLYASGRDLRREPLSARRPAAESAIGSIKGLMISRLLAENGLEAFKIAQKRGYEGLVAKDFSSPYIEGRSSKWLKVKVHQEEEMVIAGFTKPEGSRDHLSPAIGRVRKWRPALRGKSGNGIHRRNAGFALRQIQATHTFDAVVRRSAAGERRDLSAAETGGADCLSGMDRGPQIRQPVFLGLRDDKRPEEVQLPPKSSL